MILQENERPELERVIKPVMEYLSNPKKFHPHIKIIITSTSAEIVEGIASVRKENLRKKTIKLSEHLGTVDLVWEDGSITTKPIGSVILGLTENNKRYINYILYYNKDILEDLSEEEREILKRWLDILESGKRGMS